MTPYLKQAIDKILSQHEHLQDVVIVLPSKRAGVFLQYHLIEAISTVQFSPDIFSIESFIEHLSALKKANQTQQLFSLYKAYQQHIPKEEQDDFTTFMQWGSRLLKDFNDIDAYRVNAKDSLENLGAFYQLEGFNLPDNKQSFRPIFWEKLPVIYQAFQAELLGQQSATLGMLYQDALDALEIYLSHTAKTHYFIGFNALNKAEQDLIQDFLVKNKGDVFWDLDQSLYEDQLHAAGRFIRSYQKDWKYYRQNPQRFNDSSFSTPKTIEAIGFVGNIAQAQYVGEFLLACQKEKGSVAVVLGNENLLLPVLSALPEALKQWNVTMGYAIAQLPLSVFFTSLIALHAQATAEGFDRKGILQLLSFPPLIQCFTSAGIPLKEITQSLQANFNPKVVQEELAPLLETDLGKLLFAKGDVLIVDFITQLNALAELFEATFYRQKEHFSCAVMALLKKVFAQLKVQMETASFPVEVAAFALIFQESLALQTLDFNGDPIEGVQIMGMLETRALDFDHVLILNVNEGILPVGKNDQSFFPFAMKKQFGLPTFLDNDAIYTYHFYRLLQRAKKVHLLYNAKSEGLNAGEKSRFIRQLDFNGLAQHNFSDRQYNSGEISSPIEVNEIVKTPLMLQQLEELAIKGFSPTSLSAYLFDPIAFYHRYLLKIKEDITATKTLSDFQRGSLIHDCLEALYTPFIGQLMRVEYYEKMLADLPAMMLQNYQKAYPKMPIPRGENHLILKAYERSIEQFLAQESALVKQGNELVISALELPFSVPLKHPEINHQVNISGKIDRVDQLNGVTRLIDYKTGNVAPSKLAWSNWEGFKGDYKRQALFQLLLYAWAYETEKEIEVGIVSLKSPKAYVLPLNRKDVPKGENTALIDNSFKTQIKEYLVSLVVEIFDEKKSFVSLEQEGV